jgi:hypothetical protein
LQFRADTTWRPAVVNSLAALSEKLLPFFAKAPQGGIILSAKHTDSNDFFPGVATIACHGQTRSGI